MPLQEKRPILFESGNSHENAECKTQLNRTGKRMAEKGVFIDPKTDKAFVTGYDHKTLYD